MGRRNRFVDMKCGWKKATDEERRQFVRWIAGEEQGGMWPGSHPSHEAIELCAVALTPTPGISYSEHFGGGPGQAAAKATAEETSLPPHPDGGFYVQPGDKGDL